MKWNVRIAVQKNTHWYSFRSVTQWRLSLAFRNNTIIHSTWPLDDQHISTPDPLFFTINSTNSTFSCNFFPFRKCEITMKKKLTHFSDTRILNADPDKRRTLNYSLKYSNDLMPHGMFKVIKKIQDALKWLANSFCLFVSAKKSVLFFVSLQSGKVNHLSYWNKITVLFGFGSVSMCYIELSIATPLIRLSNIQW